jgi:hypothetical protein
MQVRKAPAGARLARDASAAWTSAIDVADSMNRVS